MRSRRPTLDLEPLEPRHVLAAAGMAWPDPQHLTLSFVRDDTLADERATQLFSWLDSRFQGGDWRREVLRAFQSWLEHANINLGLVNETGPLLPLGTAGAIQGDPRFGDVRVAALRMAFDAPPGGGVDPDALGVGAAFNALAGTWSGDVNLNTDQPIGPGGFDLYTVVLHEAGHALGLGHSDAETSVMFERYTGVRLALSEADIEAVQELYGVRQPDQFDAAAANDSFADAARLAVDAAGPTVIDGDLTTAGDVDYYRFSLPGGVNAATVRLRVAGRSLLAGAMTLLDDSGQALLPPVSAGRVPGSDLELPVSVHRGRRTFVVAVRGSDPDFAVGGYQLEIAPAQTHGPTGPHGGGGPSSPVVNLQPRRYRSDERFSYFVTDSLDASAQERTYRFFAPHGQGAAAGPMTILAWASQSGGLRPRLTLMDEQGHPVAANVVVNEAGTYVLQVANPQADEPYLLRVVGDQAGDFGLGIQFGGEAAALDPLLEDAVFAPGSVATGELHVVSSRVFHVVLTAQGEAGESVQLTLLDEQHRSHLTLTAMAGDTTTATLLLPVGDYEVRVEAPASQKGPLTADVGVIGLSSPLGPAARSVVQDPMSLPPGAVTRGYWWAMGLPTFVTGAPAPGGTPARPGGTPAGPTPPTPTGGGGDNPRAPAAGTTRSDPAADAGTPRGSALPVGIALPATSALGGATSPATAAGVSGLPGAAIPASGSTALVPQSSGGGGTQGGPAGTEPPGADAPAGAWLVPPRLDGLGVRVPAAPVVAREPAAAPEGDMGLPVDGSTPAETLRAQAEPASAPDAPGEPAPRAGWLWHGLGLAVLASVTTVWLLQRPRRQDMP